MTKRTQLVAFAFLCGLSILLWWHSLTGTLGLALGNQAYTHILLIVPLSAALIYLQLSMLPKNFESNATAGSLLLAGALLVDGFARWSVPGLAGDLRLSFSMFALVTWWIGSVESALAARVLFRMAGIPVTQDGIALDIPGLSIEVARECSSIRSSLVLMVITTVLAHLFLRSWWRKAFLIVAAIPLSVAKNGLRIFVIAELGTRVDPGFLEGTLHHHGGPVFLAIAVLIVIVLKFTIASVCRIETAGPLHPDM